ncbi:MAG: glycosyltransferase [Bacilli bacterium]|nr:glycosyltransferase [Bacilli bacterium]
MKILHISRTMGQGGAEKVVYQICKEAHGDVMVVASTGGAHVEELEKNGIKHFVIPDIDSKSPIVILKTFSILKKVIKEEKIDIVHSHHRMAAFYSRVLNIFNRRFKRVYTAHNVFNNKRGLLRYALKGSRIVAVGNGVKNNLTGFYGIEDDRVDVIYNSVERPEKIDTPNDQFIRDKKDKIFVATVGRISEQKGMDVFASALSSIIEKDKKVYGVIIGDGEDREKLEQQVANLGIQDNIIFLGFRKDIFALIKAMDFVVLSSRWEGFPLTPIETFSVGKTIIVSNIEGNNEIVDGSNGLLFEKDNVEELKDKIEELCYDLEKRRSLEKKALESFSQKYSYEVFIENYQKLYKNL